MTIGDLNSNRKHLRKASKHGAWLALCFSLFFGSSATTIAGEKKLLTKELAESLKDTYKIEIIVFENINGALRSEEHQRPANTYEALHYPTDLHFLNRYNPLESNPHDNLTTYFLSDNWLNDFPPAQDNALSLENFILKQQSKEQSAENQILNQGNTTALTPDTSTPKTETKSETEDAPIYIEQPIELQTLPTSAQTLRPLARRLAQRPDYRVLFHESWYQTLVKKSQAISLAVNGGNNLGPYYELQGHITLSKSRYLHISSDLWLSEFIQRNTYSYTYDNQEPLVAEDQATAGQAGLSLKDALEENAILDNTPRERYNFDLLYNQRRLPYAQQAENALQMENAQATSDKPAAEFDPKVYMNLTQNTQALNPSLNSLAKQYFLQSLLQKDAFLQALNIAKPALLDELKSRYTPKTIYQLNESRRMKKEEIHYLDHPAFGVIVTLTPFELPEQD